MVHLLAEGGGLLTDLGVNLKVVAVQVVIFVSTFILLKNLLFRRVLGFMKQREGEQASSSAKIRKNQEDLARLTQEYEARIAEVEKRAYAKLQEVLKEALDAKAAIVAEAQAQARREMESSRAAIAEEKSRAMVQLRSEVVRLSREAAQRILEEPVDEELVRRMVS